MEDNEMVTLESVELPRYREAYDELQPILATLPPPPNGPFECNVPTLVALVLRLWPALAAHKNRLALAQPDFDPQELDRLKLYALALGHAHSLYVGAGTALADCLSVVEQARDFYRRLKTQVDEPVPSSEPVSATALADAIMHGIRVNTEPDDLARAQRLLDRLETFSEQCRLSQDRLFEIGRYRDLLLVLLDGTYARVRNAVVTLRNASPEVAAQFPELLERP